MNKELQDLTYSCLPKELKEDVKKTYKETLCGWEVLEKLFGRHNLTSDAEGEDELLTVSQKQVQAVYAKNIVASNSDGHSSYDYGYYDGVMNILSSLFGSKCMPDAHEDNFTTKEPKPAEPKFKVGDIVTHKNSPHIWRCVTAIMSDDTYVLDGEIYDVEESDLKPYTEPKFKIGQKVIYKKKEL